MSVSVETLAIVLVVCAAAAGAAAGQQHACKPVDSKPNSLKPQTLAAENKRALIKIAALFELFNQTGEYFPLEFTEAHYLVSFDQRLSYLNLRDGSCADLDIHFEEDPDRGTYRVRLVQLFLKESGVLRHTCSSNYPGIEFSKDHRLAIASPLVLKCHKQTDGPVHAEIVFQELEIELDGDRRATRERKFSKPAQEVA